MNHEQKPSRIERGTPPGYQLITGPDGKPQYVPLRGSGSASPGSYGSGHRVATGAVIAIAVICAIFGLVMLAMVAFFAIALSSFGSNK